MTERGRRGLDGARTATGGDEQAKGLLSSRVPQRGAAPRDGDVFAEAVVASRPEVAERVDDRRARGRRLRREGANGLGSNDGLGVEASGL